MQVTVDETLTAIHQCQLLTFGKGETVDGDIAAYLLTTGAAVTPADDDAEALANKTPDDDAAAGAALLDAGVTLEQGDPDDDPASGDAEDADDFDDETGDTAPPVEIDVAVSTIDQVLTWVGDDRERTKAARAAEQSRGDKARTRLMAKLNEIAQG